MYSWAKLLVKNSNSDNPEKNPPLHLFITGGAGTGKSHLTKTLYSAISKTSYGSSFFDKPKVILQAPTGVAAVAINGSTIHSA